jgi:hypothetical protein
VVGVANDCFVVVGHLTSPFVAIAPVPELVDETGVGRTPTEVGPRLGGVSGLIELEHLRERVEAAGRVVFHDAPEEVTAWGERPLTVG